MIQASITSDNGAFDFTVDATPVFGSITPDDIRAMMVENEFNSSDATDQIALFFEGKDSRVDAMFTCNRLIQEAGVSDLYGFYCTVNPQHVLTWLETSTDQGNPEWKRLTEEVRQFCVDHGELTVPAAVRSSLE